MHRPASLAGDVARRAAEEGMGRDGLAGGRRRTRLLAMVPAALIVLGLAGGALFAAAGLVAWRLGLR